MRILVINLSKEHEWQSASLLKALEIKYATKVEYLCNSNKHGQFVSKTTQIDSIAVIDVIEFETLFKTKEISKTAIINYLWMKVSSLINTKWDLVITVSTCKTTQILAGLLKCQDFVGSRVLANGSQQATSRRFQLASQIETQKWINNYQEIERILDLSSYKGHFHFELDDSIQNELNLLNFGRQGPLKRILLDLSGEDELYSEAKLNFLINRLYSFSNCEILIRLNDEQMKVISRYCFSNPNRHLKICHNENKLYSYVSCADFVLTNNITTMVLARLTKTTRFFIKDISDKTLAKAIFSCENNQTADYDIEQKNYHQYLQDNLQLILDAKDTLSLHSFTTEQVNPILFEERDHFRKAVSSLLKLIRKIKVFDNFGLQNQQCFSSYLAELFELEKEDSLTSTLITLFRVDLEEVLVNDFREGLVIVETRLFELKDQLKNVLKIIEGQEAQYKITVSESGNDHRSSHGRLKIRSNSSHSRNQTNQT